VRIGPLVAIACTATAAGLLLTAPARSAQQAQPQMVQGYLPAPSLPSFQNDLACARAAYRRRSGSDLQLPKACSAISAGPRASAEG
jgi:hypothetical protein